MCLTLELMAAFVRCRYKAFLKCSGQVGITAEYQELQRELADEYRVKATEVLVERFSAIEIVASPPSLDDALRGHYRLILDAPSSDKRRSLVFPAIERLTPKKTSRHEYALVLSHPNTKLSRDEKSAAALLGTALSTWHALSVPIWCRSRYNEHQKPFVFDSSGNIVFEYEMDRVAPPEWTLRGVEVIHTIDWTGEPNQLACAKERHESGEVALFEPLTGQFVLRLPEKADRLYVADVNGDWREEIVVLNGSELHV